MVTKISYSRLIAKELNYLQIGQISLIRKNTFFETNIGFGSQRRISDVKCEVCTPEYGDKLIIIVQYECLSHNHVYGRPHAKDMAPMSETFCGIRMKCSEFNTCGKINNFIHLEM